MSSASLRLQRGLTLWYKVTMRYARPLSVAGALALLAYGSVLVFLVFDRDSHSASDTLRPFLITVAPLWAVAFAGARIVLRGRA